MADSFAEFAARLGKLDDPATLKRIAAKGGDAGKRAALRAAVDSLGGDRRFSGMRRASPLNAGYDDAAGSSVAINLRPAGLWVLAQQGRRRSGPIYPRNGSRKGSGPRRGRAVRTPYGPRARSSFRPSRGLGTVEDAMRMMKDDVPRAAAEQFRQEIARIVR